MWPTLYESANGLGVHTYGLMIMLASTAGFAWVYLRAMKVGIEPGSLAKVFLLAFAGGILGAKLLYVIAVEGGDWRALLNWRGGLAYYGAVIGGGAAVILGTKVTGVDGWTLADIAAPALLLAHGIGRMGCFFAGCCHGGPVVGGGEHHPILADGTLQGQIWSYEHFPWIALEFDGGVSRITGVPLYPTQLWSVVASVTLALILGWAWKRRKFDGQIVGLMLIFEPITRGIVEMFRADHRGTVFQFSLSERAPDWLLGMGSAGADLPGGDPTTVGLTTSQTIGLLMMVLGVAILLFRRKDGVAKTEVEERPVSATDW